MGKKTVVIVGNGPLEKVGSKIDSHDIVIRMGLGIEHLKPAYSGVKTDIWSVRGGSAPVYHHLDKLPNGYDDVWNFHGSLGNIGKKVLFDAAEVLSGLPTLGILTVIVALSQYRAFYPLSITGFNFLAPGPHYYWGGQLTQRTVYAHPTEAEKAYVAEAVQEGKLKWLV